MISPRPTRLASARTHVARFPALAALLVISLAALAPALLAQDAPARLLTPDDLAAAAADVPAPTATFAYGSDPLQYGRLRMPDDGGRHPLVVAIHGGCWLSVYDIEHFGPFEQGLVDAGYAVWSLEYRWVGDPGGGWPNTFLDVGAGVDYVRDLPGRLTLDPSFGPDFADRLDTNRVWVVGHSAGGAFALWAAARDRIDPASPLYVADPLPIEGVLALAPAPTLGELQESGACGGAIDGLLGGGPDGVPERYDAASPMRLMPEGVPQTLVVGGQDSWAPSGRTYADAARADGGSPVELVEIPESGHFEVIAPWTTAWTRVLEALVSLTGR
jgi:acetyl esterase/lipase